MEVLCYTSITHTAPRQPWLSTAVDFFCMTILEEAVILIVLFSETQRFWKDTPDFEVFSSFYQALNR
jgi:hypothetical protein